MKTFPMIVWAIQSPVYGASAAFQEVSGNTGLCLMFAAMSLLVLAMAYQYAKAEA